MAGEEALAASEVVVMPEIGLTADQVRRIQVEVEVVAQQVAQVVPA